MTSATKTRIIAALGDASLTLTVLAALPYSMGDAADVLGPKVKVYVTLGSAVVAGLSKTVQHTIQILAATNTPDAPPAQPQTPATPAPKA